MIYPGAVSVGFMGKYLRNIEWWKLEPHPEFARENPSAYCLASPGKEYLFYLRYGGNVKLDLQGYNGTSRFTCRWTDLVNNRESEPESVTGGGIREIRCPEDYPGIVDFKDWLLLIKKEQ